MAQFIVGKTVYSLHKRLTTVGSDLSHDIVTEKSHPGIAFTIAQENNVFEVIPGRTKILKNGDTVTKRVRLASCDRLQWDGLAAIFFDFDVPLSARDERQDPLLYLNILQNIAATLHNPAQGVDAALNLTLDAIVQVADAEEGYLLSEVGSNCEWKLVATKTAENAQARTRKELFSNTILKQALNSRTPVYVENIIGHPYADAASIIEARLFSVACFPLLLGQRIFGAVFVFTRTPGRSIKKESLAAVSLLATQGALMMASALEVEKLRALVPVPSKRTGFVFDTTAGAAVSPMAEVVRKIEKLAGTPLHILIQGETGTGKEIAARELHAKSTRATKPFIAINCAAIPATLLEATLFGYERGAFTGAVRSQEGKFVLANGGTLFLDEIGDLPLELQAKILRVIQEMVVDPIGSTKSTAIDVRIVSATHRRLETLITSGQFRQDLYFRLAGAVLELPPLRKRARDIECLALHLLGKINPALTLSAPVLAALKKHPWPGNVRELEHVITRAAHTCDGPEILGSDIDISTMQLPAEEDDVFWSEFETLDEAQLAFAQGFIRRWLNKLDGNREETAKRLGVSERTIYRILADKNGSAS